MLALMEVKADTKLNPLAIKKLLRHSSTAHYLQFRLLSGLFIFHFPELPKLMRLIIRSIKGGGVFQLTFNQSLPDAVTSALATFGNKQVEVWKTHESSFILYGGSIPGKYFYLRKPRVLLSNLALNYAQ